jgi:glycerol-3-phosphate acyltransferase PlsY
MLNLAVAAAAGYLLGSLPTGVIAGSLRGVDLRASGSGGSGATNSLRVLGWKAGVLVGLVDIAKGFVAAAFLSRLAPFPAEAAASSWAAAAASLAAVVGHIKPIFAGFRGGRGMAPAVGTVLALCPAVAPFCLAVFLVGLFSTGYVAFASALAALALPLLYALGSPLLGCAFEAPILAYFALAAALVLLSHAGRLAAFFRGEAEIFERARLFKRRGGRGSPPA